MNAPAFPQVREFLRKCSLLEYYDRFIAEGFDQLQSLLDATEADLIAMDVKRGHRRRLQREIVTMKGLPPNIPLPLCIQHGTGLEDSSEHPTGNIIHPQLNVPPKILYVNGPPNSNGTNSGSSQPGNRSTRDDDPPDPPDPPDNGSTKRKYKRHPKRDKNAPVKPLSAYVMFAHKVREEYAGQNISFPNMAKIVGDRWKNIRPEEKETFESEAAKKKEEYQNEMSRYKTTESWRKYQEYLKEFKEKYESNPRDSNKPRKRSKTEPSPDSDNTRSGYSSTRSTSVGCDNSSGNISSGSSNGNGNGGNHTPYSNNGYPSYPNYIPPYAHFNPNLYGYTNNNGGQNIGSSFVTPPSSINASVPSTTLADLYAKDDSNAGDDQSQQGMGSSSGNGNGNGNSSSSGNGNSSSGNGSSCSNRGDRGSSSSRSAERQSFEDTSDSTASSSGNTPPAVPMETDYNSNNQPTQLQNQNQHHDNINVSHQQDDDKNNTNTK